jgi:membrane associated rhomboid family serine protease
VVIPIHDDNPTRRRAVVTVLLVAINVGVFFLLQPQDSTTDAGVIEQVEFNFQYAAIPCEVVEGRPLAEEELIDTLQGGDSSACVDQPATPEVFPDKQVWLAVLSSMFLHGGLLHLGGNMLFLWIFGNNIEDHLGHFRYLLFYVVGGIVATGAHIAVQPDSTVPLVGASGAVAGVMGAYLVWFPRAPIRTIIFFFLITFVEIEARWLLGFWLVSQFFIDANQGVAWMAHVGGFVFGVAVALLVKLSRKASHAIWTKDHWSELERPPSGPHDDFGLR